MITLDGAEQGLFAVDELGQRPADLLAQGLGLDGRQRVEVDLVEQLAMKRELQLLVVTRQGPLTQGERVGVGRARAFEVDD